jgi:hypothetical protein
VALAAILAKLVLVRVLMTTGTIVKWHTSEFLEGFSIYYLFLVTLQAFNGFVLSGKLKPCTGVIEF